MGARTLFPLFDKLLDGNLEDRLRAARRRGASFDEIARSLHVEQPELSVTGETIRQWCHRLGVDEEVAS